MTEIRRVGVLSLAKIVGLVYVVIGIVIWLIMGCFVLFGVIAQPTNSPTEMLIIVPIFCFLPVFYGVIGFIAGALFGLVYNAVAGRMGGIEVELIPTGNSDTFQNVN